MPQGANFWNPYRWVTVSDEPIEHDVPNYHHTLSGISGRLWCEIEALTPLLIGDGEQGNVKFTRRKHNGQPYIPSTSLKGPIRSLAEVVGNATVPSPNVSVDSAHELGKAREIIDDAVRFDAVARIFGYWKGSNALTGLVHFSDAEISGESPPQRQWKRYNIASSHPKPEHDAFYPGEKNKRKFYHHHPGTQGLTKPHSGITQTTDVTPASPGTCFTFTVDFTNLRDAELDLLLYCLVLEEQVTVTLSPAALGREKSESAVVLEGPLRHKIGGAKPHGAGSSHIRITKMELCRDAMARYRRKNATDILEGEFLTEEINERTKTFRGRTDLTMRELRAMLIYATEDPRKPIHYPRYDWFRDEKSRPWDAKTPLKPTL